MGLSNRLTHFVNKHTAPQRGYAPNSGAAPSNPGPSNYAGTSAWPQQAYYQPQAAYPQQQPHYPQQPQFHQPQPYGQVPPQAYNQVPPPYTANMMAPSAVGNSKYVHHLGEQLRRIVAENNLHRFYQPADIDYVAQRLASRVDFDALAAQYHLPLEMVFDLAPMALYDVKIFADDSGSMGGSNWDDLNVIFQRISEVASKFDDTGIDIAFMNHSHVGNNLTPERLKTYLANKGPSNGTPLGSSLHKRLLADLQQKARNGVLTKPVLIYIITDGEPTEDKNITFKKIADMRDALVHAGYPKKSVGYGFAQVGKDTGAKDFLENLDRHPDVGELIDVVSDIEIEQQQFAQANNGMVMTPDMYFLKLMAGPYDRSYDEEDEVKTNTTYNYR